jgi:dihydrofolate reductase
VTRGVQLSAYLAVSLDGFIARTNGSMDWLRGGGPRPAEEARRYQEFMASVDAIVLGRGTFESVLDLSRWPYGDKPVIVLTSRGITVPDELGHQVTPMSGTPAHLVESFNSRGWNRVYVDGGTTIQRFLAAGLLHRLILNRVPVLIGSGLPLFGPLPADQWWVHVQTTAYAGGLVQSEYRATTG